MRGTRKTQMKKTSLKEAMTHESAGEGGLWELCLFTVFFVLVFSAIARADVVDTKKTTSTGMSASLKPYQRSQPVFDYSAVFTVSTAETLSEDHPQDFNGTYTVEAGAIHTPTKLSLSAKLSFSQEYSYERADGTSNNWENPLFSLGRKFKSGESFNSRLIDAVKFSLTGSLPANRDAQKRTFLGSVGPSISVVKQIGKFEILQALGYTRGFYEYDIREDGTVNSPDVFKSTTALTLNLTDKLALSAALNYSYGISFQGVGKGTQLSDLSATYQATKMIGFAAGIGTLRGTLSPDGQSDQIRFYDPDSSQVYLDVSVGI